MNLKKFINTILNNVDGETVGMASDVIFDVKGVESFQDTAKVIDIYEDNGDLVLVFG